VFSTCRGGLSVGPCFSSFVLPRPRATSDDAAPGSWHDGQRFRTIPVRPRRHSDAWQRLEAKARPPLLCLWRLYNRDGPSGRALETRSHSKALAGHTPNVTGKLLNVILRTHGKMGLL
jgi:hypothetical protein